MAHPTIKCSRCKIDVPESIKDKPGRCMDRNCPFYAQAQPKQEIK
jgi:hypothetical protein